MSMIISLSFLLFENDAVRVQWYIIVEILLHKLLGVQNCQYIWISRIDETECINFMYYQSQILLDLIHINIIYVGRSSICKDYSFYIKSWDFGRKSINEIGRRKWFAFLCLSNNQHDLSTEIWFRLFTWTTTKTSRFI